MPSIIKLSSDGHDTTDGLINEWLNVAALIELIWIAAALDPLRVARKACCETTGCSYENPRRELPQAERTTETREVDRNPPPITPFPSVSGAGNWMGTRCHWSSAPVPSTVNANRFTDTPACSV